MQPGTKKLICRSLGLIGVVWGLVTVVSEWQTAAAMYHREQFPESSEALDETALMESIKFASFASVVSLLICCVWLAVLMLLKPRTRLSYAFRFSLWPSAFFLYGVGTSLAYIAWADDPLGANLYPPPQPGMRFLAAILLGGIFGLLWFPVGYFLWQPSHANQESQQITAVASHPSPLTAISHQFLVTWRGSAVLRWTVFQFLAIVFGVMLSEGNLSRLSRGSINPGSEYELDVVLTRLDFWEYRHAVWTLLLIVPAIQVWHRPLFRWLNQIAE